MLKSKSISIELLCQQRRQGHREQDQEASGELLPDLADDGILADCCAAVWMKFPKGSNPRKQEFTSIMRVSATWRRPALEQWNSYRWEGETRNIQ